MYNSITLLQLAITKQETIQIADRKLLTLSALTIESVNKLQHDIEMRRLKITDYRDAVNRLKLSTHLLQAV